MNENYAPTLPPPITSPARGLGGHFGNGNLPGRNERASTPPCRHLSHLSSSYVHFGAYAMHSASFAAVTHAYRPPWRSDAVHLAVSPISGKTITAMRVGPFPAFSRRSLVCASFLPGEPLRARLKRGRGAPCVVSH